SNFCQNCDKASGLFVQLSLYFIEYEFNYMLIALARCWSKKYILPYDLYIYYFFRVTLIKQDAIALANQLNQLRLKKKKERSRSSNIEFEIIFPPSTTSSLKQVFT
ncbi:unnamed protein product, partial [Rotaria magnacalcarata]